MADESIDLLSKLARGPKDETDAEQKRMDVNRRGENEHQQAHRRILPPPNLEP